MATEVVRMSWWQRAVAFVRDSFHEIRHKTTWPDVPQVRQASIAIVIFVLLIGLVITLLDLALSGILIKLLPSLFAA
jgi:preprotein translocase SecE subunit